MSNFRVGQKVVCVDTQNWNLWGKAACYPFPIKGCIYTVRGHSKDQEGVMGLLLQEIARPDYVFFPEGHEVGFLARRFRAVAERKTSIEIFQRMLTPSQVDA